jgi:hypothetical protein
MKKDTGHVDTFTWEPDVGKFINFIKLVYKTYIQFIIKIKKIECEPIPADSWARGILPIKKASLMAKASKPKAQTILPVSRRPSDADSPKLPLVSSYLYTKKYIILSMK